jgi:hypothetical protein
MRQDTNKPFDQTKTLCHLKSSCFKENPLDRLHRERTAGAASLQRRDELMKAPIVVKGFAYKMPLTNSVIYGAVPPSQESRNFYGRPIATK